MYCDDIKIKMSDILAIERPYKKRPIYKISWKMTNMCPYACSYCYMSDAVLKAKMCKDNPTQQDVEEIASHFDEMIEKLAEPTDFIQLHIIGGEPSIFDLKNVLSKITSKQFRHIILATNLYRPLSYYQDLKEYCASRGIKIGFIGSFHLEMLKTEKQRFEYVNKIVELKGKCKAVTNNENIPIYKPYFKYLMTQNIPVEITVERDNENKCVVLSEENQAFIDELRNYCYKLEQSHKSYLPYYTVTLKDGRKVDYTSNIALINSIDIHGLDPTGFLCDVGMHGVRINKDGGMLRSACRLASMYFKMGNVKDINSYEKPKEMIICKTTEAGKDHKYKTKLCTCFNNASMYRLGYDENTGIYNPNHGIKIPDYHKLKYGDIEE